MDNLISASDAFDKATRVVCIEEDKNKNFVRFNTLNEAIDYINILINTAAEEGKMMISPKLFVRHWESHQKLFDILKKTGFKVYPGLAGELYALSWEVGVSYKDFLRER